jgi:hypothetical protein
METPSRADAKLKGLPRSLRDELWRMRHPLDEGDKKFTYVEILAWLKSEHGVESSLGALTPYFAWEKLNRDIEEGMAAAEQAKLEFAAKYPDASPERLHELGQLVFTSRAMQMDDPENFVKLMDAWERKQDRLMRKEQWEAKRDAAKRKQEAEDAIKKVQGDKTLTQEQQRAAIVDKMDEFFGLKKAN